MSIKSENLRQRSRIEKMVKGEGWYAVRTEAMDYGHCGMARGVSLVYCLYTKNGQLRICHAGNKEVINIEQWSAIEKISKDVNVVSRGFDWKDQNTFDNAVWVGDSGSDEE